MNKKPTLAEAHPELVALWHPTKNGDLTPDMVTYGVRRKIWWYFSFDDPETGRHFDFEWEKKISHQIASPGCPYIDGKTLYTGFNDLATKRPDLAAQWHPTKNGDLKPSMVMCGSQKKVRWLLAYDDLETGKHFDFEWDAVISDRVKGRGCPFLSGNDVWIGYNDLATKRPDLAAEWHPTKNGDLTPEKILCGSSKSVWWLLSYDDSETGKHFDFEWKAPIYVRAEGKGCPYLSGRAVWPGYNDLATKRPDLAAEWHPTKNGDLKPSDITCGSVCKVWWHFSYDQPETGKHFEFEWEAQVCNRVGGQGCPFLSGHAVWPGFNDLATKRPDLAAEWHPTKNGGLKPSDISCGSAKKVHWLLPFDDPKTGNHYDFEWVATVNNRAGGGGCPYLSGEAVWSGYNDLATKFPKLAKEWHPTKNGNLTPEMISYSSNQKVHWLFCYDDPETGKHFDFEWEATVSNRAKGGGCPFLSGQAVWPGFNDLATKFPQLAKEWHPTKNGDLTPEMVPTSSSKKYIGFFLTTILKLESTLILNGKLPLITEQGVLVARFYQGRLCGQDSTIWRQSFLRWQKNGTLRLIEEKLRQRRINSLDAKHGGDVQNAGTNGVLQFIHALLMNEDVRSVEKQELS